VALPEPPPEVAEAVLVADELADPDVQPPTTSAATSTAHGHHRREPRACSDSVTSAPCIAVTRPVTSQPRRGSARSHHPEGVRPQRIGEPPRGGRPGCPGIWKFRRPVAQAGRRTEVWQARLLVPDGPVRVSPHLGRAAGQSLKPARSGRATTAVPAQPTGNEFGGSHDGSSRPGGVSCQGLTKTFSPC
jgi:hypothetical protein